MAAGARPRRCRERRPRLAPVACGGIRRTPRRTPHTLDPDDLDPGQSTARPSRAAREIRSGTVAQASVQLSDQRQHRGWLRPSSRGSATACAARRRATGPCPPGEVLRRLGPGFSNRRGGAGRDKRLVSRLQSADLLLQFGEPLLDTLGELRDRHHAMRLAIRQDAARRWIVMTDSLPNRSLRGADAKSKAIVAVASAARLRFAQPVTLSATTA